MPRGAKLAELAVGKRNGNRFGSVEDVKGPGTAMHAMLVRRVLLLIGRRSGTAVRIVQTELGERSLVKNRSLGKLAARNRQQQWLHDQGIDRDRADQLAPEGSQSRSCLIWSALHVQERILLYRVRDG